MRTSPAWPPRRDRRRAGSRRPSRAGLVPNRGRPRRARPHRDGSGRRSTPRTRRRRRGGPAAGTSSHRPGGTRGASCPIVAALRTWAADSSACGAPSRARTRSSACPVPAGTRRGDAGSCPPAGAAMSTPSLPTSTAAGMAHGARGSRQRRRPRVTWMPRSWRCSGAFPPSCASRCSGASCGVSTPIADMLGHDGTRMTALVYRHAVAPTVDAAAAPMQALFGA